MRTPGELSDAPGLITIGRTLSGASGIPESTARVRSADVGADFQPCWPACETQGAIIAWSATPCEMP